MTLPTFESTSPRFALPLLFAGQAQKEGHVNEALTRIDALMHLVIEGQQAAPPTNPAEGQCWLVATGATGDWSGKSGQIACFGAGNWLFAEPRDGLRAFNRQAGQEIRFVGTWRQAARPAAPAGGTVVDSEARTTIAALVSALTNAGIFPPS